MVNQWCSGDLLLIEDAARFRLGVVVSVRLYCSFVHARKALKASHSYPTRSSSKKWILLL